MSNRKIVRRTKKIATSTLLIVGEGLIDKAFLNHLKSLFYERGKEHIIKIEAGDGGSPGNIITQAIRSFQSIGYSRRIIVLDADLPPTDRERKQADQKGYQIILWEPQCIEGCLLRVLNKTVKKGSTSQALKAKLHPLLSGKATRADSYSQLFTKDILRNTQQIPIPYLIKLIDRSAY